MLNTNFKNTMNSDASSDHGVSQNGDQPRGLTATQLTAIQQLGQQVNEIRAALNEQNVQVDDNIIVS